MENDGIILSWRDKILAVAEKHKEEPVFESAKIPEEKSGKNQTFLFRFLKEQKLFLLNTINFHLSKLSMLTKTEGFRDMMAIVSFVIGYGILGTAVMLTFSDRWVVGYGTILHIVGAGSGIYLFMDLFGFICDTVRGKRRK